MKEYPFFFFLLSFLLFGRRHLLPTFFSPLLSLSYFQCQSNLAKFNRIIFASFLIKSITLLIPLFPSYDKKNHLVDFYFVLLESLC